MWTRAETISLSGSRWHRPRLYLTIVAFFLILCAAYAISQPIETIATDPGILTSPNVSYIGLWFEIPYMILALSGAYLSFRQRVSPYPALVALVITALYSGFLLWLSTSTTYELLNTTHSDEELIRKCVKSMFVWLGFFASAIIMCILLKKGYDRSILPAFA